MISTRWMTRKQSFHVLTHPAQDVWMSINPTYESGDVNCLVALSESIFVAGSMDGSLRFFHADQGGSSVTLDD